jgi:hypothetical protein
MVSLTLAVLMVMAFHHHLRDKMNRNLSGYQFKDVHEEGLSGVEAYHGGEKAGHLYWNTQSDYPYTPVGAITMVQTYEGHTRKGLATAMYKYAKQNVDPRVKMAPKEQQTPEGAKWARKVTGRAA